ncbi:MULTISPECIES: N-acetylmuramoyl-L-alanine amidase [unclassified Cyanobium]|uniref:N-acetylmuramoyl-L-alanine amidase n=1 Tax=unclassified Cyanobium TaxID=2627006 RepID=UPI0020CCDCC7|nr:MULTISPECIES: N-acetylmuramoyl-L-alanine amidase [unclassified Cyanobium]MCP9858527.1 N-acetylmuramoyl-L-alanine amidase [Cyanobium sp. Cruz-8H5]MCP9865817.1 N-acetylmuramoyl-L-alanine amidase [Cyanobium sp. Cruz-8D1]
MGVRAARFAWLLSLPLLLGSLPAQAASALSAWRLSREGVLELRTSPGVRLQAFYEEGSGVTGPRVWVDLPGAPQRSRSVPVGGLVREVRIGRPDSGTTRLVLEFRPGTRLDPRQLRLVGTARDRWRLSLTGLPLSGFTRNVGEGDMDAPTSSWSATRPAFSGSGRATSGRPLSPDGLPVVPRGRFRVVIDPGHGGPDPGAVGIGGLREADVVLDVSLQVAQLLQARGVQVLMTRASDVDVDLPPRVSLANSSNAAVFVSIHANALSMARPDVNGVETFYFQSGSSQRLAQAIQSRIMAISPGTPDRGARPGRFFVIRRTVMPAALAEMGFVTGRIDAPRLADPNFRRRMAVAITAGILDYLQGDS